MPEAAVVSDASVTAPEVADVVSEEAADPDAAEASEEAFVSLVVSTVAAAVPVGPSVT